VPGREAERFVITNKSRSTGEAAIGSNSCRRNPALVRTASSTYSNSTSPHPGGTCYRPADPPTRTGQPFDRTRASHEQCLRPVDGRDGVYLTAFCPCGVRSPGLCLVSAPHLWIMSHEVQLNPAASHCRPTFLDPAVHVGDPPSCATDGRTRRRRLPGPLFVPVR
jgi:hypothetical protein